MSGESATARSALDKGVSLSLVRRGRSNRAEQTSSASPSRARSRSESRGGVWVEVLAITHGSIAKSIAKGEERVTANLYFKFEVIQLYTLAKVHNLTMGSLAARRRPITRDRPVPSTGQNTVLPAAHSGLPSPSRPPLTTEERVRSRRAARKPFPVPKQTVGRHSTDSNLGRLQVHAGEQPLRRRAESSGRRGESSCSTSERSGALGLRRSAERR